MPTWLKNNKFEFAILPIVLLLGIFIGGCTDNEAKADDQEILNNQSGNTVYNDCDIVVDKKPMWNI